MATTKKTEKATTTTTKEEKTMATAKKNTAKATTAENKETKMATTPKTETKVEKTPKTEKKTATPRKASVLKNFYNKEEDMYIIPKENFEECREEVTKKLEKGKGKDGFRFCLYADKKVYTLVELELNF